jgi:YD repeat-containing protein
MNMRRWLPNIVLGVGFIGMILLPIADHVAYAMDAESSAESIIGKATKSTTNTKQDGSVETSTYNPYTGSTDTVTRPDGVVITKTWGPDGKLTSETVKDPNSGNEYSHKYNADGSEISTVKHKDGSTEVVNTDSHGHRTSMTRTDASGNQRTETYDGNGGLVSVTNKGSDGSSQTVNYSGCNGQGNNQGCQVTSITRTNKDGSSTTTTYDKNGQPTSIATTTKDGKKFVQHCNDAGNCFSTKAVGVGKVTGQTPAGGGSDKLKIQTQALKQINDKAHAQDLIAGGTEKVKLQGLDQIRKQHGEAVGLNPQPLPPGPSPDKFSGKTHFEKKLQTEVLHQTNQTSATGISSKPKLQTEVLHVDKEKFKVQDLGSAATTGSGQIQHRRHK